MSERRGVGRGAGRSGGAGLRRAVLAVAVVVHLVVLYAPSAPAVGGPSLTDEVVHVVVFAVVAWAARGAGLPLAGVVLALLAHAVVSELVQHALLAGRTGDPSDVVADAVGVAVGVVVPVARRAGSMVA